MRARWAGAKALAEKVEIRTQMIDRRMMMMLMIFFRFSFK